MRINPIVFQQLESECRNIVFKFLSSDEDFVNRSFNSYISKKRECETCAIFWDNTKRKKKMDEGYFDGYLGCYEYDPSGKFEGRIKIYPRNILDLVNKTIKRGELPKQYNKLSFFKSVCRVVLIHELAHWLIHFAEIKGPHANHHHENYVNMSTYQHEQLAQICTIVMLKKSQIDRFTFRYIMALCNDIYHLHPSLLYASSSEALSVIKDFRFTGYFDSIPDERPFSIVFEKLIKKEIKFIGIVKAAKKLGLID